MKKTVLTLSLVLLIINVGHAQRKADMVITMDAKIKDIAQNEITGVVVIEEGDFIKGISPETQKEIWSIDTKKELAPPGILEVGNDLDTSMKIPDFDKNQNKLEIIPGSPYLKTVINSKTIVINTENGKVVFNSAKC